MINVQYYYYVTSHELVFLFCPQAKLVHTLDHSTTRPVHSLSFHHSEACLLTACADKVFVWRSSQSSGSWQNRHPTLSVFVCITVKRLPGDWHSCGRCCHLVFLGRIQQRGDVQVKVLHSPWIGWKAELPYAAGQTRNVLLWQKPVEFPVSRAVCKAGYCQFQQCLALAVSIKAGYCQFWQCLYPAVRLGTASSSSVWIWL